MSEKKYPRKIVNRNSGSVWIIPHAGCDMQEIAYQAGPESLMQISIMNESDLEERLRHYSTIYKEESLDSESTGIYCASHDSWGENPISARPKLVQTEIKKLEDGMYSTSVYDVERVYQEAEGVMKKLEAERAETLQLRSDLANARRACEEYVTTIDEMRLVASRTKTMLDNQTMTIKGMEAENDRLRVFEIQIRDAMEPGLRETKMHQMIGDAFERLLIDRRGTDYDPEMDVKDGAEEPPRPAYVRTNTKRYRPEGLK